MIYGDMMNDGYGNMRIAMGVCGWCIARRLDLIPSLAIRFEFVHLGFYTNWNTS